MITSPDAFVEAATARTGLTSFHSDSYRSALEVLTRELAHCEAVSPSGRDVLEEMIVADLARRLAIDDYLGARPELTKAPVERPLFVMGMPRTGTTLLINLLAQDHRRRPMLKWEVANPVPPATSATLKSDPRCLAMLADDRYRVDAGLTWADVHFEWADQPRECVYVMTQNFTATSYEAFAPMPVYSEYLFSCDMTSTYAVHRRMLQTLQSEAPGRWTLKAPSHVLWIPELLSVYPDARLVWTHRDPVVAVSSLCSLITRSQGTYCSEADHQWIARHYPDYCYEHVRRPMEVRERFANQIYDVHYADLVREPVRTVRALYEWLDEDFGSEAEGEVAKWLAENPLGRFGRHRYGPADFGLSPEEISRRFGDYVATYGVETRMVLSRLSEPGRESR